MESWLGPTDGLDFLLAKQAFDLAVPKTAFGLFDELPCTDYGRLPVCKGLSSAAAFG
jgi:hypothetical protein